MNAVPGWNEELESAFSTYKGPYMAGRVMSRHKTVCEILIPGATVQAGISGALLRIGKQPSGRGFYRFTGPAGTELTHD